MKKISIYSAFIFLLFYCNSAKCAKILGVFPSPGRSQYILAESLLVALAEKGHDVTVISGYETKGVKNLRSIAINMQVDERMKPSEAQFKRLQSLNLFTTVIGLNLMCLSFTEKVLSNQDVQALIKSDETYDLVIIEMFLSEALQAFAKHFSAHQVLFCPIAVSEWNTHLMGVPNIPSYLPVTFAGYSTRMDFYERLRNTMGFLFTKLFKKLYVYPAHQKLVDKYFPQKYELDDFIYNASLMLTCSHVSTSETLPLTASVVEVGGLHIKTKKLPENIQKFLDSAKHGAIFFSMGSNIHSSAMPKETLEAILTVIKGLKQKVLWKYETDDLENKPDNLLISKWLPQNDILAHPNTVAFISHCGMGSTTETIYHGVPVIGIPIVGDQFMNVRKLVQHGMAIKLIFKELSAETFNDAIQKIIDDKSYREAAKRRSKIMHDRPIKPLDEAIYWVEYVLRHDGAHHLRSSISSLSWYQFYLLDVILVLLTSLSLIAYIIYSGFRCLRSLCKKTKVKVQ